MLKTLAPAAVAILGLSALQAQAQLAHDTTACYGRAYSMEHLAAHPGQSVIEMLVVLDNRSYGAEPEPNGRISAGATIRAMVRGRYGEFFANSGYCQWDAAAGQYDCGIDCDGGQFDVALDADGSAMLLNGHGGFVLYGGCGDETDPGSEVWIPADAEHAAFKLYPLPAEACPLDMWQVFNADDGL